MVHDEKFKQLKFKNLQNCHANIIFFISKIHGMIIHQKSWNSSQANKHRNSNSGMMTTGKINWNLT